MVNGDRRDNRISGRAEIDRTITCPKCSKRLRVPEASAGKRFTCPGCGSRVQILPGDKKLQKRPAAGDEGALDWDALSELENDAPLMTRSVSLSCPECEAEIEAEVAIAAKSVECPQCSAQVPIRKSRVARKKKAGAASAEPDVELPRSRRKAAAVPVSWFAVLCAPFQSDVWLDFFKLVLWQFVWWIPLRLCLLVGGVFIHDVISLSRPAERAHGDFSMFAVMAFIPFVVVWCCDLGTFLHCLAGACSRAANIDNPDSDGTIWACVQLVLWIVVPVGMSLVLAGRMLTGTDAAPVPSAGAIMAAVAVMVPSLLWIVIYVPMAIGAFALTGSVALGAVFDLYALCGRDRKWCLDVILLYIAMGVYTGLGLFAVLPRSDFLTGSLRMDKVAVMYSYILLWILAALLLSAINVQMLGQVLRRNQVSLGIAKVTRTRKGVWIACSQCQQSFDAKDCDAGEQHVCAHCGNTIQVPPRLDSWGCPLGVVVVAIGVLVGLIGFFVLDFVFLTGFSMMRLGACALLILTGSGLALVGFRWANRT